MVIMATRESIRAIPTMIREASYATGATKWQTVRWHILPYSMGGTLTGVIIGLSRAIGDTAPIITVGALTFIAFLPTSPFSSEFPFLSTKWLMDPFTVVPIQMFNWVSRPQQAFQVNAAAAGIILMVMTILMNAVAIYIRTQYREEDKMVNETTKAQAKNLNFHYGEVHALKNINIPIYEKFVTALIGPSGCGKTTFLRCFNRMHDLYPENRYVGEILLYPEDLNIVEPDWTNRGADAYQDGVSEA